MKDSPSLCQVCDGPAMPGAPLPLCMACIKVAYHFGIDCLPDEYERFAEHACPLCGRPALLMERHGRHMLCAQELAGCGRQLPVDMTQWPAIETEARTETVLEELVRRAKEKYDTEIAGLTEGSWVYYIRVGDLIKIGVSVRPIERAKALSLTDQHIVGLERGSYGVENRRHKQFAHLRRHGEWFEAGPDLLAHIETLRAAAA